MEDSVLQRIRKIINTLSLSDTEFSKLIGKPQSTIASLFRRGNEPNSDIVYAIAMRFPQFSIEWLITGEGQMLKQQDPNRKEVNLHSRNTYKNDGDVTIGSKVNEPLIPYGIVGCGTSDYERKLSEAMIEIKYLKEIIENKDKILADKERLISVLMNKVATSDHEL